MLSCGRCRSLVSIEMAKISGGGENDESGVSAYKRRAMTAAGGGKHGKSSSASIKRVNGEAVNV